MIVKEIYFLELALGHVETPSLLAVGFRATRYILYSLKQRGSKCFSSDRLLITKVMYMGNGYRKTDTVCSKIYRKKCSNSFSIFLYLYKNISSHFLAKNIQNYEYVSVLIQQLEHKRSFKITIIRLSTWCKICAQ